MRLGHTVIDDTFAEAFPMRYARVLITAAEAYWLEAAAGEATGCATSVIGCDVEAGIDCRLSPDRTPDGRPGAAILVFGFSADVLAKALPRRVGQCVMTCPTTAVFDGLDEAPDRIRLGRHLRLFGDGYQKSKLLGETRFWRIPVMDGEFLVQEDVGVADGVGGGNIIVQSRTEPAGLAAARRAVEAVARLEGAITPFPGGVVRSGSKVGSRYRGLPASTSEAYCPTLRGRVESKLAPEANCAYEIVIDGIDRTTVGAAMAAAMRAAAGEDVVAIGAGNYGGQLGEFHFRLHALLD